MLREWKLVQRFTFLFIFNLVSLRIRKTSLLGVANGTSKNVGLGKFWQDLEVSFLHGLYLLFLSLETFYQRVSGSDF